MSIITRRMFINGGCTLDEYYGQFVNEEIKKRVLEGITIQRLRVSRLENFDDIPYQTWIDIIPVVDVELERKIYAAGDFVMYSDIVNIHKVAARQMLKCV